MYDPEKKWLKQIIMDKLYYSIVVENRVFIIWFCVDLFGVNFFVGGVSGRREKGDNFL